MPDHTPDDAHAPEAILPTYEENAVAYAQARARPGSFIERHWLERMLDGLDRPDGLGGPRRVLDLGCGPGVPIARHLVARGCQVTGVDGANNMVDLFRDNVPEASALVADMREIDLGEAFDAIVAWDSFFHLPPADQRAMFPIFGRHSRAGARLLFTSGHVEGVAIGAVEGAPVYHSSQSPQTYRDWLAGAGFGVLDFVAQDPTCGLHSVWLAEYQPG